MTRSNPEDLPLVHPMMIRKIVPTQDNGGFVGGVWVEQDAIEWEEVGLADQRLDFDEDVVDCSRRVFDITNQMMFSARTMALLVFPSRRWRNMRTGQNIEGSPRPESPLLYIGNPILISRNSEGIAIRRLPEFLIKSGMELGF